MRIIVMSLGGSVIIPDKVNLNFLKEFKKLVRKNYKNTRFIIVTGGGSIARKYISALKNEGEGEKELAKAGIRSTRMNALFLMQYFGKEANDTLPMNMKEVKDKLHKNKIVICGALRFADDETTDGTAAKLAKYLGSEFINLTNVDGLYTKDPKKDKKVKFIEKINWTKFYKMIKKIKFSPGQHFVLDQEAAKIIMKNKIKTYIIGPNTKNLGNLINGKKFRGTIIGE